MINLSLVVIKTNKLHKQSEFYSSLGFQFEYHKHGNGPYHYASVGEKPVLEIYPLPKGTEVADHTTRLGFVVDNLSQTIQTLIDIGVKIISEPAHTEWGYTAVVQDPDGRKIELTEKGE
ncbi:VOC family protein [Chitinophaga sp. OAE865]|uniref:VOC family protein n=1 Tax=Chitinophaga sp. OAE865 TaxID=2817898 RepID=UPI001AE7350D